VKAKLIAIKGTWREVADSANTTIHMDAGEKEPSQKWKRRMLLCEHSPIRQRVIKIKWYELKSWVSVHFVRHKIGIEHWVRTQRTDRTTVDRNALTQDNLIEHEFDANMQAFISISRRRLCSQASEETRKAWELVLDEVKEREPELYSACVPDCVYRGWCFEYRSCGYHKTDDFKKKLSRYRDGINE